MATTEAITFVFTDIEGSTRLWETEGDAMRTALEHHDAILSEALNEGDLFKHTGDGVCAAFASPTAAIRAVATALDRFDQESWPTSTPIRIRAGIHTGEAQHRDRDYFGTALNRTARIMDAAHGGQAVVSATTRAIVGSVDEIALEDLGEHRFKDLGERERVFQIGNGEFPPLRSLESFPNNLPGQLTSFVGRAQELAEVVGLLEESRLVTLTGVGGVGKTRLAIQVAAESVERFRDGVWLVELASIGDASLLIREVADAVGVTEEAERPLLEVLLDTLRERELLVVLDNCEHLIDETAKLAEQLLRGIPGLKLLATSREGLAIGGERLWRVPSMAREGSMADAVALFAERARHIRPDFTLDDSSREAVEKICARLDGIPLAIELATARLKVFTPQQIAERLDDRFRLLTGGSRTAVPRQRTLQATMDWSYDLLAEHEQALLRHLSVFYGGFTFEAAEEVCATETIPHFEILDLLTHLIESSLVVVEEDDSGARYRLLETVRQYGLDKLIESGEADAARRRHAEYFAQIADLIDDALLGEESADWTARLERDHDNFRAAITWGLEAGEASLAFRLAAGMGRFWFFRAYILEGADWYERMIRAFPPEETPTYAELLSWAGTFAMHRGLLIEGRDLVKQAHEVAVAVGDSELIGRSANALGNAELVRGDLHAAIAHYEYAYEHAEDYRPVVMVNMGMVYAWTGQPEKAREMAKRLLESAADRLENEGWALIVHGAVEEASGTIESTEAAWRVALDHVASSGERILEGWARLGLAEVERRKGDLKQAQEHLDAGMRIGREIGAGSTDWIGATTAGAIAVAAGEYDTARAHLEEMVRATTRNEDPGGLARAAMVAATVASKHDDHVAASTLLAAADRLLTERHEVRAPYLQAEVDELSAAADAALDADTLAAARQRGTSLGFEEIAELILEV